MKNNIYVFDFDCTITKRHTGGCAKNKRAISAEFIQSNVKNGFKEVVERIVKGGFGIYIASLSDDRLSKKYKDGVVGHELIKQYIHTIFGENQTFFTFPKRNQKGAFNGYGNVIAKFSVDFKASHLNIIAGIENLQMDNPESMKKIVFIDDDVENVCYFFSKGCTILDPTSCQKSAKMARNDTLFLKLLKHLQKR